MQDYKRKLKIIQVTEKKQLTLEKDKEDQIKYYLSYPKSLLLDIKWENGDINVVEWARIPKMEIRRKSCSVVDGMLNSNC